MSIPRGTTPTFTLTFTDIDLTQAANVYVTFSQGSKKLTKRTSELTITATTIEVHLSQEETLAFMDSSVEIQVNFTTASGGRMASDIAVYKFTKQLLEEVVV